VLEYDARGRVREGSSTTTHDGRTLTYVSRRDARGTVLSDLRDGEGLVRMRLGTERTRTVLFGRFALEEQSRAEGSTLVGPNGAREDLYLRPDLRVERRLPNGTLELSQFDEEGFLTGRATHKRASDGAEVSWGVRYERSGEGDLVSVWDSARGPVRYELDAAHRLVGVDRNGTRELIDLDPAGNVLGKRGLSRVELMEGNRLVATAEEEFVYDERQLLAGRRRRSDGRFTRYTYDSLNQLVRVEWRDATGTLVGEPWTADYDVLGRRVRFGRGKYQTELWWDGLRIAAEEELVVERGPDGSASTRRARLRIYGYPSLDALVPSGFVDYANRDAAPASGAVYQVFTDPTGLPLAIEDARGETVWWATGTHPYGDVEVHPSSRIDYAMRWPGHRLDATLGLFYNRFRDYDPSLARYLQTDPIGQRGGINVYAYCNNPLKSVDLLGLAGTHDQHTPNPAPDGDAASTTAHPHTESPHDPAARPGDDNDGTSTRRPRLHEMNDAEARAHCDERAEALRQAYRAVDPEGEANTTLSVGIVEDSTGRRVVVTTSDDAQELHPSVLAALEPGEEPRATPPTIVRGPPEANPDYDPSGPKDPRNNPRTRRRRTH
jgi:RHS repeat-associated protein